MIRNLHMLMALPSESGAVAFAAKRAEFLPVEGLCLYFPSGHQTRLEKVAYWLKRLHRDPVVWLQPSEDAWVIDLNGAKQQFSDELVKSYPYSSESSWPRWLNGTVTLTPEFETGKASSHAWPSSLQNWPWQKQRRRRHKRQAWLSISSSQGGIT